MSLRATCSRDPSPAEELVELLANSVAIDRRAAFAGRAQVEELALASPRA